LLAALASMAHADSGTATLGDVKGSVKINQGVEFVDAQPGQPVKTGDRIMVMEGGVTSIKFSDDCVLPITGGKMVTVIGTTSCRCAQVCALDIGPSDAGPIGEVADFKTVNAVGWTWLGVAAACFIWCGDEDDNDTVSP
jgi:hypothetical protein